MGVCTQTDSCVVEQERVVETIPDLSRVIFFNDDATHVEFVVHVLMTIFRKDAEEAVYITKRIHENGSAIVGVYTEEIAIMKRDATIALAVANGYPLRVEVETD